MKTDLESLKDSLKFSGEIFADSRAEAQKVLDFYNNKQYSTQELNTLETRGQPKETFNVIKLFTRLLLGYYSTVTNAINIAPRQYADIDTAAILNDLVKYVFERNQLESELDKVKLDGLTAGLMCAYVDVVDTDIKDQFGRIIRDITVDHVPVVEILLDPESIAEDYSDAEYIHRFKWFSEQKLKKLFPKKQKEISQLAEYENWTDVDQAEYELFYSTRYVGNTEQENFYLLVHTIVIDDKGKTWSIFWVDETELFREEITFKEVKFPYRVQKIYTGTEVGYYGIFREVIESQRSINQAVVKIQLLVNTQKAFVEEGGVEDIDEFTNSFNRVNAVIKVQKLAKIKVEKLTQDVVDLYIIIDKAFDRIQKVLGVNDSFLGAAFASDSGRKVKLQRDSTRLALRYVSVRIEQFYRMLGWDMVNLMKQFWTAEQVVLIADEVAGDRWIAVNSPLTQWTGQFDAQGQPVMEVVFEESINPNTGKPEVDENGRIIIAPVPTAETDISFTDVDISIDSVAFNDQDETAQLLLETMLQGVIGQSLLKANPSGFFTAASLAVKGLKSKYSPNISAILDQTSAMTQQPGVNEALQGQQFSQSSPKSRELKLPQNTNEGI